MDKARTPLKILISLFLTLITIVVFWRVNSHEFINYDDNVYIIENRHVREGLTLDGISWAFTSTYASNWHPLTWLSHMLDCELYESNPVGHHLTNVFFHIVNTVLLFLVLNRATGAIWRSSFVAAMFALHPVHVESVAWVAERKDVLSALFWLLTIWTYIVYVKDKRLIRYIVVFLFYGLGLMTKPMLVTLPFVMILLDYWPLERFRHSTFSSASIAQNRKSLKSKDSKFKVGSRFNPSSFTILGLIWEKIPLFVLSLGSSAITIFAQAQGGAVTSLDVFPLKIRIANVLVSYVKYIGKILWPHRLAVFYPHPGTIPIWQVAGAGILLLCVLIVVCRSAGKHPYFAVGWLWYLVTLVPVIGIVQVGEQALADRYTYIPFIGLFIMIAWGVPDVFSQSRYKKPALIVSGVLILTIVSILSFLQLQHWRNNITLFSHALNVTTNNYLAHTNLGAALIGKGKVNEGIDHYKSALEIKPNYPLAHYNFGVALHRQGMLNEAISHYLKAVQLKPKYVKAHSNIGAAFAQQGKYDRAIFHFKEALRIKSDLAEAHFSLGRCLSIIGKLDEAIAHYKEAIRIRPNLAQFHYMLGITLVRQGKYKEGAGHIETAVKLKPLDQRFRRVLKAVKKHPS